MRQGYASTSTRQIAQILKITQPAIYHHFQSKEIIYVEVLRQFALNIGTGLEDCLHASASALDILVKMSVFLRNRHPFNFSLMMHDMLNELSQESRASLFLLWRRYYFNPFFAYFSGLKPFMRQTLDVQTAARHFMTAVSAYITDNKRGNALDALQVETFASIYLHGIIDCRYDISEISCEKDLLK